jgi:hypothetical protein
MAKAASVAARTTIESGRRDVNCNGTTHSSQIPTASGE